MVSGGDVPRLQPGPPGGTHWAFDVEYDGSRYFGFQFQTRFPTVAGELLKVFRKLLLPGFTMRSAGRTDAGVHAQGMVVSVRSQVPFQWERFLSLANRRLPPWIRLKRQRAVDWDFDPRREAVLRHYRYVLATDPLLDTPMVRGYALYPPAVVDWDKVTRAAGALQGSHHFLSFVKRPKHAVHIRRRVERIEVSTAGPYRFVDFWARSFLRGQVRAMVGWLLAIGQGRHEPEAIDRLLAKATKDESVRPAGPQGLYLMHIWYPGDEFPSWFEPPVTVPALPEDDDEGDDS